MGLEFTTKNQILGDFGENSMEKLEMESTHILSPMMSIIFGQHIFSECVLLAHQPLSRHQSVLVTSD